MSNAKWEVLLTPAAADSVNVRGTNTACVDLDVYVIFTKGFWVELVLVEFSP
jgi:hypothetical protein